MLNKSTKNRWIIFLIVLSCYLVISLLYYLASEPILKWRPFDNDMPTISNTSPVGEMTDGFKTEQLFLLQGNGINKFSIMFATYDRVNEGVITVRLIRAKDNAILVEQAYEAGLVPNNSYLDIKLPDIIKGTPGEEIKIQITAAGSTPGHSATMWYGEKQPEKLLFINGQPANGTLCFTVSEVVKYDYGKYYFMSIGFVGFIIVVIGLWICFFPENKKVGKIIKDFNSLVKYRFLLSQLIGRDFKIKYRRSYLGIVWSILNPLLMMIVISSVFSYVFRFNVENFPVYLILGQTLFNFLSESTSMAMSSIIGSGNLIKKIFIPKIIFPLEKVMFSFINFVVSFIAIFIVILFFQIPVKLSIICLPFILIYIFVFSLGIGLFLSSFAVFFRDTLHLYSILLTAWAYLTPIFYPVNALSGKMASIMSLNPMFHYIKYFRNIILYGTFPSIYDNWVCIVFSLLSILIGSLFFKKRKDQFILYI